MTGRCAQHGSRLSYLIWHARRERNGSVRGNVTCVAAVVIVIPARSLSAEDQRLGAVLATLVSGLVLRSLCYTVTASRSAVTAAV
jgi:hypothetical protein